MTDNAGRWRRAALAAGAAMLTATGGVGVGAETLEEALARAYENNPALLAERARLRSTDEGVAQASSEWRPSVTVNGNLGYQRRNGAAGGAPASSTSTRPRGLSLSVDQNVYRGGRGAAALRRAEHLVRSDRAGLSATEQAVLLDAATAYVNVVRDQAVVRLNVNNERVLKRRLEATQDRFRVGEVTRTDVAQAESRLSRARADRIAAEGALARSRSTYGKVIGAAPGAVEAAAPLDELPESAESAVELARMESFAVLRSDEAERAARERIDEVAAELLPALRVSGEVSHATDTAGRGSESDTASVTARVTMPLYQSGAVRSRVRAAKHDAARRRYERDTAKRNAVEQATVAWEELETARAQIQALTAEARAARIALEGVRQEESVGSRTVLEVLDAEQELLDAQVRLARAERDHVVASYRLRAAVGRLTARDLGLPVAHYDPDDNYRRARRQLFGIGIEGE